MENIKKILEERETIINGRRQCEHAEKETSSWN